MINSLKDLHFYISADLFRYMTSCTFKAFCRAWFIPGFRYTFLLRWCNYLNKKKYLIMIHKCKNKDATDKSVTSESFLFLYRLSGYCINNIVKYADMCI